MGEAFVDYYELLQVSPNADEDTIHRVYRHLAKKWHPDAPGQGDPKRFNLLVEALQTLTNPESRAAYDVRYQQHWNRNWKVLAEATDGAGFADDAAIREQLLSVLYVQRRQNMRQPGIGEIELARLVGLPHEHLEFHLWYLKESGWIQRLDTGFHAITAQGVDEVERRRRLRLAPERLIESRASRPGRDGKKTAG